MKKWQAAIGNALILGMIVFISALTAEGATSGEAIFPPPANVVYTAFLAGFLTFLTQCKGIFQQEGKEKDKKEEQEKFAKSLGALGPQPAAESSGTPPEETPPEKDFCSGRGTKLFQLWLSA